MNEKEEAPSLHRAPRWSRALYRRSCSWRRLPSSGSQGTPGVSGAVRTPGTHRAALWPPAAVATWLLLPSETEHSDQATHRLRKLTARARPLPTSSSFCQVCGGIREGRPLHPGSRGGDSQASSRPLGTCSLSKKSALMLQASQLRRLLVRQHNPASLTVYQVFRQIQNPRGEPSPSAELPPWPRHCAQSYDVYSVYDEYRCGNYSSPLYNGGNNSNSRIP